MDKELSTKMGRKYPKCHKIYLLKLSAQAQKFGIFKKKTLWVSVVRAAA